MREQVNSQAAIWAAILASGVYHGLNPAMGWPLAVAAGLTERRVTAVTRTLAPLAVGHLMLIALVLLPFGALTVLLDWSREIRIAAGLVIVGFSGVLLLYPRHPRWLSRMRPTMWARPHSASCDHFWRRDKQFGGLRRTC